LRIIECSKHFGKLRVMSVHVYFGVGKGPAIGRLVASQFGMNGDVLQFDLQLLKSFDLQELWSR